jgi:hypothetical protein
VEWARQASFVAGVSDMPLAQRPPAARKTVEREEA